MDPNDPVLRLFESHSKLFWEKRFTELSESHYRHPMPVYAHGTLTIRQTPAQTAGALFTQRQIAVQRGMCGIRLGKIAFAPNRQGRFPVTVTWEFLDASGDTAGELRIRYFMSNDAGALVIEMADYLGGSHTIPIEAVHDSPQH